MKKIVYGVLFFSAFLLMSSCTNKEGSADLDVITPSDSTQSKVETHLDHLPGK